MTFPVCVSLPAVCSGEITDSAGVVLSPNWPEAYDKGQDCIWGIHVEEDKRIMLDIQVYVCRWEISIQSPDALQYVHPSIHPFVFNHCSPFRRCESFSQLSVADSPEGSEGHTMDKSSVCHTTKYNRAPFTMKLSLVSN